jgi:hypothetical protein
MSTDVNRNKGVTLKREKSFDKKKNERNTVIGSNSYKLHI